MELREVSEDQDDPVIVKAGGVVGGILGGVITVPLQEIHRQQLKGLLQVTLWGQQLLGPRFHFHGKYMPCTRALKVFQEMGTIMLWLGGDLNGKE